MIGKRPPNGSHISHMAKQSCSSRPRKKRGMEIAPSDNTRDRSSGQRFTYTADSSPAGMPMATASAIAAITSSSVAGR